MSTIVDIRASEIQIVHTTNIGKETAILFIRWSRILISSFFFL